MVFLRLLESCKRLVHRHNCAIHDQAKLRVIVETPSGPDEFEDGPRACNFHGLDLRLQDTHTACVLDVTWAFECNMAIAARLFLAIGVLLESIGVLLEWIPIDEAGELESIRTEANTSTALLNFSCLHLGNGADPETLILDVSEQL